MSGRCSRILGVPAVRQVVGRLGKSEQEEQQLIDKLAKSCRKFDRSGTSSLTVDEYFNVIKLQNGIDITKDEVRNIMGPLKKDKDGKVKIDDFLTQDIHSQNAFKAIDRNKDGFVDLLNLHHFVTKGELKLAKKNVAIKDIDKCIKEHDMDKDGKLNLKEFEKKH